ncbi:MAG: hypothetical protein AAFX50_24870, partial [Acidobacteriota bacterium]
MERVTSPAAGPKGLASALVLGLAVCFPGLAPPAAADWPGILGAERAGRTAEPLPAALAASGPKILWRTGVGEGMAGVAVAGNRVLVHHRPGTVERLEAFSTVDGASLWRVDAPTDYRGGILPDSGPRAVPTVSSESEVAFRRGVGPGGIDAPALPAVGERRHRQASAG